MSPKGKVLMALFDLIFGKTLGIPFPVLYPNIRGKNLSQHRDGRKKKCHLKHEFNRL